MPQPDERGLVADLILGGGEGGGSSQTLLNQHYNYRKSCDNFDPAKVARYTAKRVEKLLGNPGIIRNRLKVASSISNAKAFIAIQKEFGSFDAYVWQFVGGKPKKNSFKAVSKLPATTAESDAFSKDLKQRGFRFVGSTICYAFMQAVGMVNDHTTSCFRYKQV